MKELLSIGLIVLLTVVTIGVTFDYTETFMGIADNSPLLQAVRIAAIGLLLGLVLTKPPRSMYFRIALTVFSAALFIGTAALTIQYQIALLDTLTFFALAHLFAIEALEAPTLIEQTQTSAKSKKVSFRKIFYSTTA